MSLVLATEDRFHSSSYTHSQEEKCTRKESHWSPNPRWTFRKVLVAQWWSIGSGALDKESVDPILCSFYVGSCSDVYMWWAPLKRCTWAIKPILGFGGELGNLNQFSGAYSIVGWRSFWAGDLDWWKQRNLLNRVTNVGFWRREVPKFLCRFLLPCKCSSWLCKISVEEIEEECG